MKGSYTRWMLRQDANRVPLDFKPTPPAPRARRKLGAFTDEALEKMRTDGQINEKTLYQVELELRYRLQERKEQVKS